MAMDYFRRPVLAGSNLPRTQNAIVRGTKRRTDADGTSLVPYFPGVVAGQTLSIKIQATTYVVTLTSGEFLTILNDINTVIGAVGTAFDADGCVGLSSKTLGWDSLVAVTSGTAADGLGFDLITNESVGARGGEIPSAPEAGAKNWFGTAFARKNENFSIDSVNRGVGRLASNMDVLHSDLVRGNTRLRKANTASIAGGTATWTPSGADASKKFFTGFGLLSAASTKDDLAPFFLVIDPTTKQVARSRVVAVTKGVPGVTPPPGGGYTNTANWAANDGGNILGQDLVKVSSTAVSEIREGRVVVCPGANFTTSNVVKGDFVEISGATNKKPWDHNGYRWVVEDVRSATALLLRPMSKSELALMGIVLGDSQPVLELNPEKEGIEVYGNVIVKTGPFSTNVTFVFDPPLPANGSYDLWAAQPVSDRDASVQEDLQTNFPLFRDVVSDFNPSPNGLLSGFAASLVGSDAQINSGYYRLHGRVFFSPQSTLAPAAFVDGDNYVYLHDQTGVLSVGAGTTWRNLFDEALSTRGHLIAVVTKAAGSLTAVTPSCRLLSEKSKVITVGVGGQFADLNSAAKYIASFASAFGETTSTAGAYSHFEVVIVSNLTLDKACIFEAPSLRLSGASPAIRITYSGAAAKLSLNCSTLGMSDLSFDTDGVSTNPSITVGPTVASTVHLTRVTSIGSWRSFLKAEAALNELVMRTCDVATNRYGIVATANNAKVSMVDCRFTFLGPATNTPRFWIATDESSAVTPSFASIQNCMFVGWATSTNTTFLMSIGGGVFLFEKNQINSSLAFPANSQAVAITFTGSSSALVEGNTCIGEVPVFFSGALTNSILSNNRVRCKVNGTTTKAVTCGSAYGNHITLVAPDTASTNGIALETFQAASGNFVTGPFGVGIQNANSAGAVISENTVDQSGTPVMSVIGIRVKGTRPSVSGNNVRVTAGSASSACIDLDPTVSYGSIIGNTIQSRIDTFGIATVSTGATRSVIAGNTIFGTDATIGIRLDGGVFDVSSNFVRLASVTTFALELLNSAVVTARGNRFDLGGVYAPTTATLHASDNYVGGQVQTLGPVTWSGNYFTDAFNHAAGDTKGSIIENNTFTSVAGGALVFSVGFGSCLIRGNHVKGNFAPTTAGDLVVDGNYFEGTVGGAFTKFSNNVVQGAFSTNNTTKTIFGGNHFQAAVTVAGAGKRTFNGDIMVGAGAISLTSSFISSCYIGVDSNITFTDCTLSSSQVEQPAGGTASLVRCQVSGCHFTGFNWQPEDCEVTSSRIDSLSPATSSSGTFLLLDNCHINANFVVSTNIQRLHIGNTFFNGNYTASFPQTCVAEYSNCHFNGTFASSPASHSNSFFNGTVDVNAFSDGGGTHRFQGCRGSTGASTVTARTSSFWSTSYMANSTFADVAAGSGILQLSHCWVGSVTYINGGGGSRLHMEATTVVIGAVQAGMNNSGVVQTSMNYVFISNCDLPSGLYVSVTNEAHVSNCAVQGLQVQGTTATIPIAVTGNTATGSAVFRKGLYRISSNQFGGLTTMGTSTVDEVSGTFGDNVCKHQVRAVNCRRMTFAGNQIEITNANTIGLIIEGCEFITVSGNWIKTASGLGAFRSLTSVERISKWIVVTGNYLENGSELANKYAADFSGTTGFTFTGNICMKHWTTAGDNLNILYMHGDALTGLVGGNILWNPSIGGYGALIVDNNSETNGTITDIWYYATAVDETTALADSTMPNYGGGIHRHDTIN